MSTSIQDLRYALRMLARAPGFSTVIILTLGLGIGANTAIFSLMDQVLLRSLTVHDPAALVQLDGPGPFSGRTLDDRTFSYPMYRDLRDGNTVFSGLVAQLGTPVTLSLRDRSERVNAELVSGNTFDVLGVAPFLGRALDPRRRPRAGWPSGRAGRLRLLAATVRRRSRRHWPGRHHQQHAHDRRRRRAHQASPGS